MLALTRERNLCENLSLTLGTHCAIVKGSGIYVSIGPRKESLRELTANLDFRSYKCQPMIMLVSMKNEGNVKHTMAMRRE